MRATAYVIMVGVLTAMVCGLAAADTKVLTEEQAEADPVRTYLMDKAREAFEARQKRLDGLEGEDQIGAYQEDMRRFFLKQLGGFPERTPLNARTVESIDGDGYRIEKVIYESRPGFFVTAALFLPESEPPYPGVLVPCGHSANGKANEGYQQACIFLARSGMAAFIYDPIGQGERYQVLKEDGTRRFGSTFEHTLVGVGCILLGTNTAAYRIWDGMRGIDYLCSREEIDPDRIGCTGNSGGGTLTSYIMALDERVQCAAPSCYLTTFERLLEDIGPQDAEQDIYGQVAYGMGHGDYIIMRAPKPTLICCATQDFFNIRGTWDTFREAKRVYSKLGFAERVDLVEAPEKHGFTVLLRQGAVRAMRRWLLGIDDAVAEPPSQPLTEQEIQCTPDGQVLLMQGARSVFDINAERADRLVEERKTFWAKNPRNVALEKVRETAGIRNPKELSVPRQETIEEGSREGGTAMDKLMVIPDDGVALPALSFQPSKPSGSEPRYLLVHGEGKAAAVDRARALAAEGNAVFAPDITSTGEIESDWGIGGWTETFGPEWKTFYLGYLLGKPILALRTEDIIRCAKLLQSAEPAQPVHLVAIGEAAPAALHAAALAPGLFASVRIENGLVSWDNVVRTPLAKGQLINTVHGALRYYDLPELAGVIPPDKLDVVTPVDATGNPVKR